jgi:endonuclease/exonuclease/phosphatase family metal-dependent hydrolase
MGAERSEVSLATYNIHGCRGRDGRREPARVARVIAELGADVVALQEVFYPDEVELESRQPILFPELAQYLFLLGPTLRRRSDHFGNVLLVRHPIRRLERLDLSVSRREPRGALDVTLDVAGVELRVVATHLGLSRCERRTQVGRLLEHLDSREGPFMALLGDFNDWLPGRSVLHQLEEKLGIGPRLRSFPGTCPLLALDRIWVHPRSALLSQRVHRSPAALRASDHLPVVATVALPEVPQARASSPAT